MMDTNINNSLDSFQKWPPMNHISQLATLLETTQKGHVERFSHPAELSFPTIPSKASHILGHSSLR